MPAKYDYEKLEEDPIDYIKKFQPDDLVKLLEVLSESYYNTKKNLVSDKTFDKIRNQLVKIDPTNEYLETVGAPIKGLKNKVELPYQMGSLSKIKEEPEELEKWTKKYKGPYILSDKMDGVSAQIYKDPNGQIHMYTRGNGFIGQDISHLLKFVEFEEKKVPKGTSIRGELIISKSNFKKISDTMANARNAVAGLVNSKTVDMKIAKLTDFIAYGILSPELHQIDQMKKLADYKFNVVNYKSYDQIDIELLAELLVERKAKSNYEIDGLVCFDNSDIYSNNGDNFKSHPDYAFAFKMVTETVNTKVKQVIWSVSRRGLLVPRIEIEPISIGGTTIKFATAFNAKYIVDNVIGKGALITMIRSGDVIPYILKVLKSASSGKPDLPDVEYEWNKSGVNMITKNLEDDDIKVKVIGHFFEHLGVKGLGNGIAKKLVDAGYDTILKVLKADQTKLAKIEGLGEKSIDKIFDEIDNAMKKVPLNKFMHAAQTFEALGSRKIGEILKTYPNILLDDTKDKDELIEKIVEIKGFSDITAKYFADGLDNFKKLYLAIGKIYDLSRFEKKQKKKTSSDSSTKYFDGKNIVFTGFRDKDLEKIVEDLGGKVTGSVSSKTFLVVHADSDATSSKLEKAKELNVKIVSRKDFQKLVEKYKI